jgi:uncharacterized protein (TIRG00374 family)
MTAKNYHIRIIIGILVGAIFLYLSFRSVNIDDMLSALANVDYGYTLLAVLVVMLSHCFRALRWRYLLAPIKTINTGSLFSALVIGYAANTFIPAHLGEFLRAFVLGKKHNIYISAAFASIVVERILDVFSLILLMILAIFIYPFPNWIVLSGYIMLAGTVCVALILVGCRLYEATTYRIIRFVCKPFPDKLATKTESMTHNFLSGITPLKNLWHYLMVAVLSTAIWFCYALVYYSCLYAFNLVETHQLPWYASLVILVITTISIVVPSSPGYVGTYHYLCQMSLVMFGVSSTEALSFATVSHVINIIPVALVGLVMANYEGIAIYQSTAETRQA